MTIKLEGAAAAIAPDTELKYEYTASESISEGDAVALNTTNNKVVKAKSDSWDTMPAIGIATETKDTDEEVEIIQFGIAEDVSREADFSADEKIFVSPTTAGRVTTTCPTASGQIIQSLGQAKNALDIVLEVDHTCLEID